MFKPFQSRLPLSIPQVESKIDKPTDNTSVLDKKWVKVVSRSSSSPRLLAAKRGKVGSPSKKKTKRGTQSGTRLPMAIAVWPIIPLKLRFTNNATPLVSNTNGLITAGDIIGAIGVFGRVTNTSVTAIASSFRIKRATMYLAGAGSSYASASIIWFSTVTDQMPDFEETDSVTGNMTLQTRITSVPPKKSTAGFWYNDTIPAATQILGLYMSNNYGIVELDLDFTLPTGVVPCLVITVATAVVGTPYRLALNRTNGSNTCIPLDYTSTS
jgi:hypothetical protein